jgi:hypothetical protein
MLPTINRDANKLLVYIPSIWDAQRQFEYFIAGMNPMDGETPFELGFGPELVFDVMAWTRWRT